MKFITTDDVRNWIEQSSDLTDLVTSIGAKHVDRRYMEEVLGTPTHLQFAVEQIIKQENRDLLPDEFDSISFYSLCRGLFVPLSFLDPARAAKIFGLKVESPPNSAGREALLVEFFEKEIGMNLVEKLSCVLGDAFMGRKSTFRRDSMMRLLLSVQMKTRNELLDRLTHVGDVAVLFAESRDELRGEPALTANEVFKVLRYLPDAKRNRKFQILRSLLARCGKVEAYFLAKLLLRKAGFGFDYQGPLLARLLGEQFNAPADMVAHAMALTDAFKVAEVLSEDGVEGLKAIQLQPLVPVRPALAGGSTDDLEEFPVWVERKYDGIRFMLHKSTGQSGSILCGAYTRNRRDWLELVNGLDMTIKMLNARDVILDGELYGTVLDLDGVRPATVYEVYASLQGESSTPVNLKFAAFDIIYLNGEDLTNRPLSQRRDMLAMLLAPLAAVNLPVAVTMSEGQVANDKDDVNRLYHHFRAQGYEVIITKDIQGKYSLAARDPKWANRKPQITLDLVLLGAVYAVTTKQKAGVFGSYVIGARNADGGYDYVGDVAGMDQVRDGQVQQLILRDGLLTGKRIERASSSGVRPGVELRPAIVITVKFEGIVRDQVSGDLSLRDPKVVMLRSDKSAGEADSVKAIEEIYLRQRVG